MSLFEIENTLDNIKIAKPVNQKTFIHYGMLEDEIQKIIIGRLKQEVDEKRSDAPKILGEELLFIAEEYSGWQDSRKHLDILALDKKGNLVVIELKRNENGLHMDLQTIRYAAMVSQMTPNDVYSVYAKTYECSEEDTKSKIEEWFETTEDQGESGEQEDVLNSDDFLKDVRIILVNQNFSSELTSCVLWLLEKEIDISCIKITPYQLNGQYLWDMDKIIPLAEANDFRLKQKQKKEEIKEQKQHNRDYTKYKFKDTKNPLKEQLINNLPKNQLVFHIVKEYVKRESGITFEKLHEKFPDSLHRIKRFGVIRKIENIEEKYLNRYFSETIFLDDRTEIAVCNQWAADRISGFIAAAHQLGFEIEAMPKP